MTETLLMAPFTVTDGPRRHGTYAEFAATGPVHRIVLPTGEPAWLITGYDEARQALHDPRLVKSAATLANIGRDLLPPAVFAAMGHHMLNSNPPDHTRLRRLVTAAFTRRRVEQLAPRIQQITDELLDVMADAAQVDLIDAFAYPLPLTVICELLGVPVDRRTEFREWSSIMVTGVLAGPDTYVAATTAMVSYLQELIEAKRAAPVGDLLSALVAVRDGADRLTEDELTSMAFLLLVAGHETTVNLIGNGLLGLLRHPDQFARLRADPDLALPAVDEMLRHDPPVHLTTRTARAELTVGGRAFAPGDAVIVLIGSANRDPEAFARPAELDLARYAGEPRPRRHLAFGLGLHYCLGRRWRGWRWRPCCAPWRPAWAGASCSPNRPTARTSSSAACPSWSSACRKGARHDRRPHPPRPFRRLRAHPPG